MTNTAHIIDGKQIAANLRASLKDRVTESKIRPGLAVILVGEDPASQVYVRNKIKACADVGIQSFEHILPENVSENEVLQLIYELNGRADVHGILLQLPLPKHLNPDTCVMAIDPEKDVDGLHPQNIGKLVTGLDAMVPCTPQGSLILLKTVQADLTGLHAVVIGRSVLFGKPMGQLLLQENCTVTQCHSHTKDLPDMCRQADILIAAVGRPQMVKGDWIKDGAIVIDVGINRIDNPETGKARLVGDVAYDEALQKAKAITPVPGGVGPMTIACLLANTIKAAK